MFREHQDLPEMEKSLMLGDVHTFDELVGYHLQLARRIA